MTDRLHVLWVQELLISMGMPGVAVDDATYAGPVVFRRQGKSATRTVEQLITTPMQSLADGLFTDLT